jgi:hypothetical protein
MQSRISDRGDEAAGDRVRDRVARENVDARRDEAPTIRTQAASAIAAGPAIVCDIV